MRWVQKWFDFYIDASVHVALAVGALVYLTFMKYGISFNQAVGCSVFYGTIVSYNFVKYATIARKYFYMPNSYLRGVQLFSLVCLILFGYYFVQINTSGKILLLVASLLTCLYALPLLPGKRNFRSLRSCKTIIVALCWAILTVLLPLVNANLELTGSVWVLFLQRILLVLALMIPFEIRDVKYDDPRLDTLPQRYGVKGTKYIGYSILILFFVLTVFRGVDFEWYMNGLVVSAVGLAILKSEVRQTKYYCSFWVESLSLIHI